MINPNKESTPKDKATGPEKWKTSYIVLIGFALASPIQAKAEDPLYCTAWLDFLQSGVQQREKTQNNAQKKTASAVTKLAFEKSLHRFVHISRFTNRGIWLASLLLDSTEALTGSLGDPYRGSPEKLSKFFELDQERQTQILNVDFAFSKYLTKILFSIQDELPKPLVFKQNETQWNGQMKDNNRYLTTLEVQLDEDEVETVKVRDDDTKLETTYTFDGKGEVTTVAVNRQIGVAYEGKFREFEMNIAEYEKQVHSSRWGYPAVRKAEKRNWMALQGFLFHLDGVRGDCKRTLASKKKPHL